MRSNDVCLDSRASLVSYLSLALIILVIRWTMLSNLGVNL